MAYSFDNRVKFIIYICNDIDNNGFLDKNDFECLALRNTIIELRGNFENAAFENNQKIMRNLWNEIAELADFNKDGQVTVEEFKEAIQKTCTGKSYSEFPQAFKTFIGNTFKTIDVNGTVLVGVDEYRLDCVQRSAFSNVQIDDAYKIFKDEDRKAGGINLARYQELYAQFISNPDEKANAVYLFGPLQVV
ncbi:Sarcoplasmic calcium-binding protein 1 [Armadillidium vulgare]|nr:Sarcoplasmic calcium-binding protein 1 [Armadillidium vulgare]